MKSWPDNLPPIQPWNEEKHAMMNRIKRLEQKAAASDELLYGALKLLEKAGAMPSSTELIAASKKK